MIAQGEIRWVSLGDPHGSAPAGRRPVLILQSDAFNRTDLATTIVAVVTRNTRLAQLPGNVFLPADSCGLGSDSVVNVTALTTVDKANLGEQAGVLPLHLWQEVARGVQLVLNSPFAA